MLAIYPRPPGFASSKHRPRRLLVYYPERRQKVSKTKSLGQATATIVVVIGVFDRPDACTDFCTNCQAVRGGVPWMLSNLIQIACHIQIVTLLAERFFLGSPLACAVYNVVCVSGISHCWLVYLPERNLCRNINFLFQTCLAAPIETVNSGLDLI